MADAYETDRPIDRDVELETKNSEDRPTNHKEYLAIVGSLMYASLGGKPDISYAVTLLSRFNIDPRTRYLTAAKQVLRNLKQTKNLRLLLEVLSLVAPEAEEGSDLSSSCSGPTADPGHPRMAWPSPLKPKLSG